MESVLDQNNFICVLEEFKFSIHYYTKEKDTDYELYLSASNDSLLETYELRCDLNDLIKLNAEFKRFFATSELFEIMKYYFLEKKITLERNERKMTLFFAHSFFINKTVKFELELKAKEIMDFDEFKHKVGKMFISYKKEFESLIADHTKAENKNNSNNDFVNINDKLEKLDKLVKSTNDKINFIEKELISCKDNNNKVNDLEKTLKQLSNQISSLSLKYNLNYGICDKKMFNILHFSNMDIYSPTKQVLIDAAKKIGVTLNITEDRGNQLSENLIDDLDSILVSVWSSVDQNKLGDLLNKYIERGVNIVVVLFSNSNNYTSPQGSFIQPLQILPDDGNHKSWFPIITNHPLLEGNPTITAGSDKRRAILKADFDPSVDVVAMWEDKIPMMAIRKDKEALITSLGFQCGSVGSQDGLRVVVNALRMKKK